MIYRLLKKLAATLTFAAAASSYAYPDKPLTIIVPFAAGSATDVAARTFADVLSRTLKQGVVVDNRTGAEGAIGARAVLAGPTDGHTLLFTSSSLTVLDPLMKANLSYNLDTELTPICTVGGTKFLVNLTGSSPLKSMTEVIAAAKASPGQLTFAYSSASTRLAGELFQQAVGVKLTGVPYRSSMSGLTEVASGQVDLIFIDALSAGAFYQGGKVRPLAVAGASRVKELPEVPSAAELGLPEFSVAPWYGVYLSAKVPQALADQVRSAVSRALNLPEMKAAMEKRNLTTNYVCGDAMKSFQKGDSELWRRVTKKAGIEPQ
ncbi:MAG: tripartite tricarboxylate transporter substrate binding protein [Variovorax sp.]|nr:MAG: tripartite tricarboxylate transporter substrate binding protein [Variovorax sp.]